MNQMPTEPVEISSDRAAELSCGAQDEKQIAEEDNAELVAQLRQDAMDRRTALHLAGKLLDSSDLCKRLGITDENLVSAVREKRMFAVEGPSGAMWYPSFFVTGVINRRKLEQVSVALGDLPGDAKWRFFLTPKYSLDQRTPLVALDRGETGRVLSAAVGYKERRLGR